MSDELALPTSTRRSATMHDVAERAGVSHQTVSRYLRFNGGLRPETSARIAAAIDALGYRPNLSARSMRTGRSGRIALVLSGDGVHSPGRLIAGASTVGHKFGYVIEVLTLEGNVAERGARVQQLADSGTVEGILSFAPLPSPVLASREGAVILSSADYDDEGRTIGGLADSGPIVQLIDGLIALGHTQFAHVTGDLAYASARARRETFERTIALRGVKNVLVHEGDWSPDSGREVVARLAEKGRATALIAANDVMAAAAVREAVARGWTVPDDLSITGWDDHVVGRLLFPALTTIDADFEGLGARSMRRLLGVIEHGPPLDADAAALFRVIWRESTGTAPS